MNVKKLVLLSLLGMSMGSVSAAEGGSGETADVQDVTWEDVKAYMQYPEYTPESAEQFVKHLLDRGELRLQAWGWWGEFCRQGNGTPEFLLFEREVNAEIVRQTNNFREYVFKECNGFYANVSYYPLASLNYDRFDRRIYSYKEEALVGRLPEDCNNLWCKIGFCRGRWQCSLHKHKLELIGIREYYSLQASVLTKAEAASSKKEREEQDRCNRLNRRDQRIARNKTLMKLTVAAALTVAGGIQAVRECRNPGTTRRSLENAVRAVGNAGAAALEYAPDSCSLS